jgi:hypothetical protein
VLRIGKAAFSALKARIDGSPLRSSHKSFKEKRRQVMQHIRNAAIVLSLAHTAQSLYWSTSFVKCQTLADGYVKACGFVSERTCVVGSCSGGHDIPHGPDNTISDAPSPVLSDHPTLSQGATRRDVQYSFVSQKFENQDFDFASAPISVVRVALGMDWRCDVEVDGSTCQLCTYCGDDKYTTDCTNIPQGRMTYCESAKVDDFTNELVDLFFPLTWSSPAETAVSPAPTFPTMMPSAPGPSIIPASLFPSYVSTTTDFISAPSLVPLKRSVVPSSVPDESSYSPSLTIAQSSLEPFSRSVVPSSTFPTTMPSAAGPSIIPATLIPTYVSTTADFISAPSSVPDESSYFPSLTIAQSSLVPSSRSVIPSSLFPTMMPMTFQTTMPSAAGPSIIPATLTPTYMSTTADFISAPSSVPDESSYLPSLAIAQSSKQPGVSRSVIPSSVPDESSYYPSVTIAQSFKPSAYASVSDSVVSSQIAPTSTPKMLCR